MNMVFSNILQVINKMYPKNIKMKRNMENLFFNFRDKEFKDPY